jgi:hypothetical protein
MRDKLLQIEAPLAGFKQDLFDRTRRRLMGELRAGPVSEENLSEYRFLFDSLLSRGDFVDAVVHLTGGQPPLGLLETTLAAMKANNLFVEERKPPTARNPAWEKLVGEISRRLDLDMLDKVMARPGRTPRRRAAVLRRLRRNVAEYCTVVRIPMDPGDTFTPFLLPRVEAVVAASLRFLTRYR